MVISVDVAVFGLAQLELEVIMTWILSLLFTLAGV
jgi:hypothetical protein